ncbi:reverse transcriptase domain-containing protein [Tanacetum coccineum]|uniref:Reverse transcriptase domain-containing protein n=1 Tax=Tanacetum coccineum TaxID=301880 RepID=A0ABQ4ZRA8_9ASTR
MKQKADVLSKLASVEFSHLMKEVLVEIVFGEEHGQKIRTKHDVYEQRSVSTPWNLGPTSRGKKGDQAGVLLAYHARRRQERGGKMRLIPNTRSCAETTQKPHDVHPSAPLGHSTMGMDHSRAIKLRQEEVSNSFGLPRIIVTDNGAQLVNDPFKSWCGRFEIHQMNTAVAHPQANGLVERANRSLMEGIKTRLSKEKAG